MSFFNFKKTFGGSYVEPKPFSPIKKSFFPKCTPSIGHINEIPSGAACLVDNMQRYLCQRTGMSKRLER